MIVDDLIATIHKIVGSKDYLKDIDLIFKNIKLDQNSRNAIRLLNRDLKNLLEEPAPKKPPIFSMGSTKPR